MVLNINSDDLGSTVNYNIYFFDLRKNEPGADFFWKSVIEKFKNNNCVDYNKDSCSLCSVRIGNCGLYFEKKCQDYDSLE
ncbi:hypothetical protein K9L67_01440 [Candidatus Woesearchaeota archaeon]|nr:hypothetical protein [Candidatus Woesearchaeota archaeon]MCF7900867.1 hypothetical protein [Candidatus Woesearchaeota archaeon]MCF8013882.1 hypothetical protein [Candidatus Woesearchaeota archaeon]